MRNLEQLDKLNLMNETREREAGKQLADDNLKLEKMQQQLQQLIDYREEYKAKLNNQLNHIDSAAAIRDYHNFILVLDQAIQEQHAAVNASSQQARLSKDQWMQSKGEVKKIEKIKERTLRGPRYEELRTEQKQTDELSSTRYGRD